MLLQALLCTVQELVTLSGEELPKDPWESGKKLYVERAGNKHHSSFCSRSPLLPSFHRLYIFSPGVFAIPLQNKVFA